MKKRFIISLGLCLVLFSLMYFYKKKDFLIERQITLTHKQNPSAPSEDRGLNIKRPVFSEKSISEVIDSDDVCSYLSKIHEGNNDVMKKLRDEYFQKSELATAYQEYEQLHRNGQQPHKSHYPRLIYHLAQAGLVASKVPNVTIDLKAAKEGLEDLAASEPSNTFYPILLLSIADFSVPEMESMIGLIKKHDDFDSHLLSYAKEVAEADKGGAVSSMIKIDHLSTLNMPDWSTISKSLNKKFRDQPELLQRIGTLMMKQGLQAEKTYWEFGFSILEYNTGRKFIPTSQRSSVLNANEINTKVRDIAGMEERLELDINTKCTDQVAKGYQEYFEKLRKDSKGLGIIL